jgi:hypothetical protein
MANLALSTQIPQIGDSSQQLLARMAAATVYGQPNDAQTTLLASASRTTSQYLNLTPPQGAIGFILQLNVTAIPGVDTVNLVAADSPTYYTIANGSPSAAIGNHKMVLRNNIVTSVATSLASLATVQTAGLISPILIGVQHSGAGSFTYSLTILWLRK